MVGECIGKEGHKLFLEEDVADEQTGQNNVTFEDRSDEDISSGENVDGSSDIGSGDEEFDEDFLDSPSNGI